MKIRCGLFAKAFRVIFVQKRNLLKDKITKYNECCLEKFKQECNWMSALIRDEKIKIIPLFNKKTRIFVHEGEYQDLKTNLKN